MKIEQYVMAYGVEQDRLRAILPEGFTSLRPVLRINAEIRNDTVGYVEFNTAVQKDDNRGWLNIGFWDHVPFTRNGKTVVFKTAFLEISFTGVGIEGSCPAEKDNAGCYFAGELRTPEIITANKEFCDCSFRWSFTSDDAHGVSIGKTLPAIPTESKITYPKAAFTVENAAQIPCDQVLGTYKIIFERVISGESDMEKYFKSIIDQDYAPIVICDLNSTILYMNPASIARYHGDLTGKNLQCCHNADSNKKIEKVLAWFNESVNNNVVYTSRNEKENKDVYMIALRDKDGTLIGYYEKHEYRNNETAKFYDI